jgi:6-phosphogluconolactonase
MKNIRDILALSLTASLAASTVAYAQSPEFNQGHAVFLMTNDAQSNEIIAYTSTEYGTLDSPRRFQTGGRGSGGNADPLSSQGSLSLSQDKHWLFAVNAGSGTLSVFRVADSSLILTDQIATGGAEPVAVTQNGNLVYVLNAAASSSVVGFHFEEGHLTRMEGSQRFLSANGAKPGAVTFSPDGHFLLAVEETGNNIDVFEVAADGTLSAITVNPSAGPGAFAVSIAPNGTAIVSETGTTGATAAISSYSVHPNGSLITLSASVPTLGAANCWNAITPNGRFVYASNAGSSTIAGFAIGNDGLLRALPGTIVGTNPAAAGNLDIAISANGKYLYSLNSAGGSVGMFAINVDGTLTNLGTVGGLPAGSSLNGIAAD